VVAVLADVDLEVEVRAGGEAVVADSGDHLAGLDLLPGRDVHAAGVHVAVPGVDVDAVDHVVDDDELAGPALLASPGVDDLALGNRVDGGSDRRGHVRAVVVRAPTRAVDGGVAVGALHHRAVEDLVALRVRLAETGGTLDRGAGRHAGACLLTGGELGGAGHRRRVVLQSGPRRQRALEGSRRGGRVDGVEDRDLGRDHRSDGRGGTGGGDESGERGGDRHRAERREDGGTGGHPACPRAGGLRRAPEVAAGDRHPEVLGELLAGGRTHREVVDDRGDDVEVVGGCVRRCGRKLRCRPCLGQLRGLTRTLEFSELATGERCRSGHGDRRHGTGPPGSFRRRAVPTGTGFITKR